MTRIVQFAVPFSPNLGDGVISDCLGHAIGVRCRGAEFVRVDLSGRGGFGDVTVQNRRLALRALAAMPPALRQRLVTARLSRMLGKVTPAWAEAVEGADLAIIGGGQLFSDADLNFCIKVAFASRVLTRAGVPVVIHAAGVARNWSPRGAALFSEVFDTDLRLVGLRDAPSIAAWCDQTAGLTGAASHGPEITHDPGLLAAACYGAVPRGDRIGIGVTASEILTYHADDPTDAGAGPAFFADLAAALAAQGHRVALFCNGAVEDRLVLDRLAARRDLAALGVEMMPPPKSPAALARMIGGFRAVIAHRLHACIIGHAYARPVIGLGWDRKVESFFASVGRPDAFLAARAITVPGVVSRLERALADPPDQDRHARVIAETWEGVDRALAAGLDRARQGDHARRGRTHSIS